MDKVKYCNFKLIDAAMLGLYVDYRRPAVGHTSAMWQAFYSETYANTVKYM